MRRDVPAVLAHPAALPTSGGREPITAARATSDTDHMDHMDRLAPILVDAGAPPTGHLPRALAFAARFAHDPLQLEQEWELLLAAMGDAWQRGEHPAAVTLSLALSRVALRVDEPLLMERALRLGISAAQQTEDNAALAHLQGCLGGLLYARGRYEEGWQLWHAALNTEEAAGQPLTLPSPSTMFVHAVDIVGGFTGAQRLIDRLEATCSAESDSLTVAYFVRGWYARVTGDAEGAQADYRRSLERLTRSEMSETPDGCRQLFMLTLQAEYARALGQYDRSMRYARVAHGLTRLYGDRYTLATLVIDQALFALQHGRLADARSALRRLRSLAPRIEAPHPSNAVRYLEHALASGRDARHVTRQPATDYLAPGDYADLIERLTLRELEILRLVGDGLPNREIAARLIVTEATVKKHLEHAYAKLDCHSRTAALARARSLGLLV